MKAYFRRKIQKQKAEEEKKMREEEEKRRKEDEERREVDRLREAEARETKLEAKLIRMMSQHAKHGNVAAPLIVKKKSPRTKAHMLREIRSYLDESEDDSNEVREEAGRLIEAIEKRKGKRKIGEGDRRLSAVKLRTTRTVQIDVDELPDEEWTPPARKRSAEEEARGEGILEFAFDLYQRLSAVKASELKKMCNEEGIEWTKKKKVVTKLVRCRTRVVYGEGTGGKAESLSGRAAEIESTGGEIWADSWKKVRSIVGESVIQAAGRNRRISDCKADLGKGDKFMITRVKVTSSGVERRRNVLMEILRRPWKVKELYQKNAPELLTLYKSAFTFVRKATRYLLKNRVTWVVRVVFGTEIRRRPLVKIPFSMKIDRGKVRDITAAAVKWVVGNPQIGEYIAQRVRVVFKKNLTVGQILHGQRTCEGAEDVRCTCRESALPKSQGHVKVRIDDIPQTPKFVMNSRNVTYGDTVSIETLRTCAVESLKAWSRGKMLWIEEGDLAGCYIDISRGGCRAMSAQQVREWGREIASLVAFPIDRNPRGTLVVCPLLYHHACKLTFNWNASFVPVQESEEQVLKEMRRRYEREGMGAIATWGKGGKIRRAYVLPKDKDQGRWRPISPATSDPARLASARIGRAIRYMTFTAGDQQHFDLRSTDELKEKCGQILRDLEPECGFAYARNYDVKDMFARLSHGSVMEATRWIVDHHRRRNLVGVRVSRRGKICMMARNQRKSEGFILITFEQSLRAVSFELENTFTMCTNEILKQEFGIPMGRNYSPALACLVCARSEAVFLNTLGRDRRFIRGMRMIDDVAIVVGLEDREVDAERKAGRIMSSFELCYDESLNLVRKDEGSNVLDFLGTRVIVDVDPVCIHVHPKTRNQYSLAESGNMRIHSMQDFHSFSKKSAKRANLVSCMMRAVRLSTSDEATLANVTAVMMEANLRGYPSEVSLGALARFAKLSGSH
ncbi:hypothetical protein CBR_g72652 [Chara braunii]|uniref:Reverse transcriptase domain-containing protein n=1 Tax=Chara braunii TaxID=69332 RepID=A0A388KA43_CHABU|nr:hypothetical protein CBR_g72652 [Chara braunii]|eukprot:GBG66897.1 hypothetical protein CBR_g72652 [Chara braunii]